MNIQPFNIENSFICQYLIKCIINIGYEETNWLLERHDLKHHKFSKFHHIDENVIKELFKRILFKINYTINRHQISDFVDLLDPLLNQSLSNFKNSLDRYLRLLNTKTKINEETLFMVFMNEFSVIATGKLLTSSILLKYIDLISHKNPDYVQFNFLISHVTDDNDINEPTYNSGFSKSEKLDDDVFEPIYRFVSSDSPAVKILIPILRVHSIKYKNYWILMVIQKEKARFKNNEIKNIYFSSVYSPFETDFQKREMRSIKNYFKNNIFNNVIDSLKIQQDYAKIEIIEHFINNWKMHVVSKSHPQIERFELETKLRYFITGPSSSVYVLEYIRHFVFNLDMNFNEENVPYFRERIIKELFDNKIIPPVQKQTYDYNQCRYKLLQNNPDIYDDYFTFEENRNDIVSIIGHEERSDEINLILNQSYNDIIHHDLNKYYYNLTTSCYNNPYNEMKKKQELNAVGIINNSDNYSYLTPNSPVKIIPKLKSKTLIQTPVTTTLITDTATTIPTYSNAETTSSQLPIAIESAKEKGRKKTLKLKEIFDSNRSNQIYIPPLKIPKLLPENNDIQNLSEQPSYSKSNISEKSELTSSIFPSPSELFKNFKIQKNTNETSTEHYKIYNERFMNTIINESEKQIKNKTQVTNTPQPSTQQKTKVNILPPKKNKSYFTTLMDPEISINNQPESKFNSLEGAPRTSNIEYKEASSTEQTYSSKLPLKSYEQTSDKSLSSNSDDD